MKLSIRKKKFDDKLVQFFYWQLYNLSETQPIGGNISQEQWAIENLYSRVFYILEELQ